MTTPRRERPPREFMGPYNVPPAEFPEHKSWVERDDLADLSLEEFFDVRDAVVAALSKHGGVAGESQAADDFFVYDDKFFDRTQKVELELTDRLPKILAPAVAQLQQALAKHPLWRVMFIGHGRDDQADQQYFVVYPDVVRIRQFRGDLSTAKAVTENAHLRLAHFHVREEHRKRRGAELRRAVAAAMKIDPPQDAELVVWFDTISFTDFDFGSEGKPATSVWVLLREPFRQPPDEAIQADLRHVIHWATPDGDVTSHRDAGRPGSRLLIHFRDDAQVRDELTIRLGGKQYRFVRPRDGGEKG